MNLGSYLFRFGRDAEASCFSSALSCSWCSSAAFWHLGVSNKKHLRSAPSTRPPCPHNPSNTYAFTLAFHTRKWITQPAGPRHCVDNNETLSFGTSYYLVPLYDHLSTLVQTLPFHKLARIPTTFRGMMGVTIGLVHEDQDSGPFELLSHEII